MLKQEWKKLLGNKIMLIVIVAIIAIPTIYTTLFLGSMWDPYGNIDKLPVAVVTKMCRRCMEHLHYMWEMKWLKI